MVTQPFNVKNSMSMLVQKSQDHKKAKDYKMMIRDYAWLMISKKLKIHIQVKPIRTSSSLKSMITTTYHNLKIEVKVYELKTKVEACDEVLKLKNIKKDGYTRFQHQEQYEHVGPEVTRSQEGKRSQDDEKRLCLVDDLKEVQVQIQVKPIRTSSSLKSKITMPYAQDEVKDYELKTKCKRAKQCALYDHEGGLIEHCSKLWEYRQVVLESNPGSTCHLDVDEDEGRLFWSAVATTIRMVFEKKMEDIRQLDQEAFNYLMEKDLASWCRAFFGTNNFFASFENDIFEKIFPPSDIQPPKKKKLGGSSVPSKAKRSGKGDGSGPSKAKKGGEGGGTVPTKTKKRMKEMEWETNGRIYQDWTDLKYQHDPWEDERSQDLQLFVFFDVTITNTELAPTEVGLSTHAPSVGPLTQVQAPNEEAPNEYQVPTQTSIVNSSSSRVQVL
ncbi:hypothetical protein Tco_1575625 [Tanacetum coccineum]